MSPEPRNPSARQYGCEGLVLESEYRRVLELLRRAYDARSNDEGQRAWADVASYLEAHP